MITQTSEYALRAVVYLAQRPEAPLATQELSKEIKVSVGYLQKILRMLARAGILMAQRGVGGGFTLAKTPDRISVLDVLQATDTQISRIERCPLGIKDHTSLCALHRLLDEEIAHAERRFASTSIADLIGTDEAIQPLCKTVGNASLSVTASKPPKGENGSNL